MCLRLTSLHISIQSIFWSVCVLAIAGALGGGVIISAKRTNSINRVISEAGGNQTGIVLLGHVFNVDIPSRVVQISWLIIGCGSMQLSGTTTYGVANCGRLSVATNFFVDGSLEPNGTYDPDALPYPVGGGSYTYVQSLNEFQTSHLLEMGAWNGLDALYAYPFDTYFLRTNVVAQDSNSNSSFNILSLSPVDSTNNFTPIIVDQWATKINATGTAVQGQYMRMTFRRTALAQFFIVAILVVNWGLTIAVLHITVCAANGWDIDESILVLPLSVILTIPALRALWVGAPGFGLLLDTFGLFVQMIVVSICSVFLIAFVALRSKRKEQEPRWTPSFRQDPLESQPVLLSGTNSDARSRSRRLQKCS